MSDSKESGNSEVTYSHSDVAVIFDVSRQATHNWQKEPFTAEQIEELIADRQADVDRIKARWRVMRMEVEELEELGAES